MQTNARAFRSMSNDQLLREVRALAARERQVTAELIASLAEIDARQLYLAQGCQSLFEYCTDRLHFSERPAGVAAPPGNAPVSSVVAAEQSSGTRTARPVGTTLDRPVVAPLALERYRVQFTIGRETRDKLRRAQDLLRHTIPNGDPAIVFDRALTALLANLEKRKLALVQQPRQTRASNARARYIPASTRREVWARDGGRCAFVGAEGRCAATGFLEFHHVLPYAEGGLTVASNLELRCRAHNAYEAAMHFGHDSVVEQPEA